MGDAAAIEVTTCNVRQKSDSNYCCSVSAEPLELGAEGQPGKYMHKDAIINATGATVLAMDSGTDRDKNLIPL